MVTPKVVVANSIMEAEAAKLCGGEKMSKKTIPLINLYRSDLPGNFNEFDILKSHWPRVVKLFENDKLPPYEFIIHPTCICNLRCKWCIGQNISTGCVEKDAVEEKLRNPDNMIHVLKNICSYEKKAEFVENGKILKDTYRVKNISFSGLIGEPLMAKEAVLRGMNFLVNNNIRTGIFTNGLLIDNDCVKVFSNINYVLISLDAAKNDTYNHMKCSGISKENNVDKILQNINKIHDAKIKNHTKTDINVGFVVNEYNYNEISLAAKKLKEVGVHYLRLKFDIAIKHKLNEIQLEEVRKQIQYIHENIENDYFKLIEIHRMSEIISSDQHRLFNKCFINKLFAAVGPDAHLYACNYHAKKGGIRYLSLLENDFSDVWDSFTDFDTQKCPRVCDPFKNRANNMLNALNEIYTDIGLSGIEKYRREWIEKCNND